MRSGNPTPSVMYADILRTDFCSFVHRCFIHLYGPGKYRDSQHLMLMAAQLENVRFRRSRRLIINVPPRHLKSFMASIVFPAWLLGHDPTKNVMCLSYAQDVADKFARQTRILLDSPFYKAIFETRLSPHRQATADFETTKGGSRFATSVGGVVTARGADIIIIDDPMKADEAQSDVRRAGVNEWFDNTLRSRLDYQDEGAIVIVMQRLHIDDLVAHVQEGCK